MSVWTDALDITVYHNRKLSSEIEGFFPVKKDFKFCLFIIIIIIIIIHLIFMENFKSTRNMFTFWVSNITYPASVSRS
jgi:uncharacterized integral membrane protein